MALLTPQDHALLRRLYTSRRPNGVLLARCEAALRLLRRPRTLYQVAEALDVHPRTALRLLQRLLRLGLVRAVTVLASRTNADPARRYVTEYVTVRRRAPKVAKSA